MSVAAADGAEGARVEVFDDRVVITRSGFISSLRQGARVEVPVSEISDVVVSRPGLLPGVFVLIGPGQPANPGWATNNTNPRAIYFDRGQQPALERVRVAILEHIFQSGPQSAPAAPWASNRSVVLFLTARPVDPRPAPLKEWSDLNVDLEQRVVLEELQGAGGQQSVELELRPAVTVDYLINDMLSTRPTVLHFSGHGLVEGLIVETQGRGVALVQEAALLRICSIPEIAQELRLIVLNACLSARQANMLASSMHAVVGTLDSVKDSAAIAFSKGFYNALGHGTSTASAFAAGVAQVSLEGGEDEAQKYALFANPAVDPSTWGLLE